MTRTFWRSEPWKDKLLFEYEIDTFEPRPRRIAIDGWGLTNDGRRLIASDGSHRLHFLDPDTLAELGAMKLKRKAWDCPFRRQWLTR